MKKVGEEGRARPHLAKVVAPGDIFDEKALLDSALVGLVARIHHDSGVDDGDKVHPLLVQTINKGCDLRQESKHASRQVDIDNQSHSIHLLRLEGGQDADIYLFKNCKLSAITDKCLQVPLLVESTELGTQTDFKLK